MNLFTNFKFLDDSPVTFDIGILEVIQQFPALSNHHHQGSFGSKIFLEFFEVLGQVLNLLCEQGDLRFR